MTEKPTSSSELANVPEAVVRTRGRFSVVWIVPVAAVLIGSWLVYKALAEKGPTITISFKTAEGLEAGKTKIKYKDVEVGKVEAIGFSDDLSHVVVTAQLIKQAESFLSENTRFWVVRARVAGGQASGLGTLFSGAYIGLDPGQKGAPAREFKGLEKPPIVTADLPGRHFRLKADRLGSLDFGSPVYYRQLKVGQVVAYELAPDRSSVDIKVFIHAPHHENVRKNTRFWNAGGIDLSLDANGIKVNTESFATLMIGGVAFDTPATTEDAGAAEEGQIFELHATKASIYEREYTRRVRCLLHFGGSVRGLSVGAPVEFRGIKLGEVIDIKLQLHPGDFAFRIPVLVEMEPDRIQMVGGAPLPVEQLMPKLVEKGLRAQLKSGNLLTGQLLIDLDFHPDAPVTPVATDGQYPELPTIPTPIEQLKASATELIERVRALPLEQIVDDLRHTVKGARRLVDSEELQQTTGLLNGALKETQELLSHLRSGVAPEMSAALKQTTAALESTQSVLSSDSALQSELKRALAELANAAKSIGRLADYLERHPDALVFGKEKTR